MPRCGRSVSIESFAERFTPESRLRVPVSEGTSGFRLAISRQGRLFPASVLLKRGDVGEVAVALLVVEPVADREAVRDLEADVADRQVDPPALGLGQQRADLERARVRAP